MAVVENKNELLNTPLHGVYIPVALLLIGIYIVNPEWLIYGIPAVAALAAFKFWRGREKSLIHRNKFTEFSLLDKVPVSPNTAIYRFALEEETDSLYIPPGQHIEITLHAGDADYTRAYNPISSELDQGHFELLIKDYPNGVVTQYLNSLQKHQTIKVKGPFGNFKYEPNMVKHLGLIASGTGISPMLQIVSAIIREPTDTTRISLIYANTGKFDILLKEDIDQIAEKYPYFRVHYVLEEAPENWSGSVGYVTENIIKEHLPAPSPDTKILVCGPEPMVTAMKKATEAVGFAPAGDVSATEDQVFYFDSSNR